MTGMLHDDQLTGLDESHLVEIAGGHRLVPEVVEAFDALRAAAAAAGFDLAIASSYRSFARQLGIWNGKACGARPVHDDAGCPVLMDTLSPVERLHAILRYSALPGASRHHWGTDLDVYDAAALPAGRRVQLVPAEVAAGGWFDPLHRWLDECMATGRCHGFYRPYAADRGGVAPERWHLSYAPLAQGCAARFSGELLRACWDRAVGADLLLRAEAEAELPALLARYVTVPEGWC